MEKLEGPSKRYTTGAFPTHSNVKTLASNFANVHEVALAFIMQKEGWLSESGKPTKRAANEGLLDAVDGEFLWKLSPLLKKLNGLGNTFERQAVNQDLPEPPIGEPQWANLGTIGTYFSVSAKKIGDWLDALKLRHDGMASNIAIQDGLAVVVEMGTGGGPNSSRRINHWNLHAILNILKENGHNLDFDYAKTLKGSGHNSDVKVETVDDRAKAFAKEFSALFKDKTRRRDELPRLVDKTGKPIQKKAEILLGRPDFISTGLYKKYLDRE